MNEIIVEETGLPLVFPDYREVIRKDAEAFRRLSAEERMRYLQDVIQTGWYLSRISPNRQIEDELFLKSAKPNGNASSGRFSIMNWPTGEIPLTLLEAASELGEVFARFQIRYALIGALAAGYRSRGRSTRDVDFLLSIPQLTLPPLLEELQTRGFEFDLTTAIREWTQHHMLVMSYHATRVDWLKPPIPAYVHVLDVATEEPWLHHPIRIASAEGVILLKLIAFRPQDQVDIESVVVSNRALLNVDWIRSEWQSFADLDDPRMQRLMEWVNV